ncbi:hypothetical protein GGR57DRAFT_502999 [Xylariaceae sp. FL1272]|nr:hypothetical protein GGR57DRAFT_502999 [Xylariaceae sp. FL1272]
MNSLIELAKMQVQAFELAVKDQTDSRMIPIDKILEKDNIILCNISNTPADIGAMIEDTFSSFITGDILDGVSKLVNNGLKLLMGSYSGNSSTRDSYAITCGHLGGISRVDMHFYSYRYRASQLTEIAKEVLCVSLVRSSVDSSQLSDEVIANIVESTYAASSLEEQQAMLNQLLSARDLDRRSRLAGAADPAPLNQLALARVSTSAQRNVRLASKLRTLDSAEGAAQDPTPVYDNGSRESVDSSFPVPRESTTTYTRSYSAKLQINTASVNTESLKNWIYGYMYSRFEKDTIDNGITVICQVHALSTSNSELVGLVSMVLRNADTPNDSAKNKGVRVLVEGEGDEGGEGGDQGGEKNPEVNFVDQLNQSLAGAVSNKCPIPVTSYTVASASGVDDPEPPADGANGDDGGIGPWPKSNENGETTYPDDFFSDVEEFSDEQDVAPLRYIPNQNRKDALERAKDVGLTWENGVNNLHVYLYPTPQANEEPTPLQETLNTFFGHGGSHVHIVFDPSSSSARGWAIRSVIMTICNAEDRWWIKDNGEAFKDIRRRGGDGDWHYVLKPGERLVDLVDEDKLEISRMYWFIAGLVPNPGAKEDQHKFQRKAGYRWRDISSRDDYGKRTKENQKTFDAVLKAIGAFGKSADKVLDQLVKDID